MERSVEIEVESTVVARRIAGMHLGRWDEVSSVLMVRLVPAASAGPLAVRAGPHLAFEISLAIAGAAVTAPAELLARWQTDDRVDLTQIRKRALMNTEAKLSADVVCRTVAGYNVSIVSGGLFTTGLVATAHTTPERLGMAPQTGRRRMSALSPTTVAVVDEPPATDGGYTGDFAPTEDMDRQVARLCEALAARVERPLPANLFDISPPGCVGINVEGSFASVRILE
jgi:hypothetical protein